MFRHHLAMAWRTVRRQRAHAFINVAGLGVGIACCILIFVYTSSELSYDRFHDDAATIYRVVQEEVDGEGLVWSGPQMGLLLARDFPHIESTMRVIDGAHGYGTSATIRVGDDDGGTAEVFEEEGFLYVDPGFFSFFTFPLLIGSPERVLDGPGRVVVTESVARKYFGGEDPVGRTLLLDNRHVLEVTGVAADPPERSHLTFHFVASFGTFYANRRIPGEVDSFWWPPTHTYVRLPDAQSVDAVRAGLPAFVERHRDADDASRLSAALQPLTGIWLGPNYRGEQHAGGSRTYLLLFSAIAGFILLLACVNFINLSTARGAERMREVGVRKAVGASRCQLATQFMGEFVLLSLLALLLAVTLAEISLPFFEQLAVRSLSLPYDSGGFWLALVALMVTTGLVAGSYPALHLSGFRPIHAIRGTSEAGPARGGLRRGLVVFQFTVSIALLICTAVVLQQMRFVQETSLGFDREHVVVLPGRALAGSQASAGGAVVNPRFDALEAELLRRSEVQAVTASTSRPGVGGTESTYVWAVESHPDDPNRQYPVQMVGKDFFEVMQLDMVAGRALRADEPADIGTARMRTDQQVASQIYENRGIVLNETAARRLGWTPAKALGKHLRFYVEENDVVYQDYRGAVVGVVRDYHTASLHEPIAPMAYMSDRGADGYLALNYVLVKTAPGDARRALASIQAAWTAVVPEQPFVASFLDEHIQRMYVAERRLGRLVTTFAGLAVLVACLGLFGLAAFVSQKRTREIGIRKVLGASAASIVRLLSRESLILIAVAFVLAAPIAHFAMSRWLEDFAYRITLGPGIFLLAGGAALAIAMLTVGYHAVRAATADPVRAIRME